MSAIAQATRSFGRRRWGVALGGAGAVATILLGFAPVAPSQAQSTTAVLRGQVVLNDGTIAGAHVSLLVGSTTGVTGLAEATADTGGAFTMEYAPPAVGVLYVQASAPGAQAVLLRAVVGVVGAGLTQPPTASVTVNELTTVATSYALAQFIDTAGISGSTPGLENAAATAVNLVNPVDGAAGAVVTNDDNGSHNDTLATLNTLANLVSLCTAVSSAHCSQFLSLAHPKGSAVPKDAAAAILNLARNPTLARAPLYALAGNAHVYAPTLDAAPDAWLLVLLHTASELYASGRIAIDAKGNVWSSVNWLPGTTDPSPYVAVLNPVGEPTLGSPISGGGMKAGAWGIAIANRGDAWIPSFGGNAISQYAADGTPISPGTGWTNGDLNHPQGSAVDQKGNLWIANNYGAHGAPGDGNIVVYPAGDPSKAFTISGGGLNHPFAVQIDGYGRAWITNGGPGGAKLVDTRAQDLIGKFGGSITVIGTDFKPTSFSPIQNDAFKLPIGLAIDSHNNAWTVDFINSTVTQIRSDGRVAGTFQLPRATAPWSEAIDGSDRVWVAGFGTPGVWVLCGEVTAACGEQSTTGALLSPTSGYQSQAFQHLTSIQIDRSGNVWVSNNWSRIDPPTGGVGIAVIIGAATPVCTPLTPLPARPSSKADGGCSQQVAAAMPASTSTAATSVHDRLPLLGGGVVALILLALIVVLLLRRHRRAN